MAPHAPVARLLCPGLSVVFCVMGAGPLQLTAVTDLGIAGGALSR